MKKVLSIVAVVVFAVGMFATQADKIDIEFDIETMLACKICGNPEHDPRIEIA